LRGGNDVAAREGRFDGKFLHGSGFGESVLQEVGPENGGEGEF
jgi:hypothetical protein